MNILLYNTLLNTHSLTRAPKLQIPTTLLGLQAQFAKNPKISLMLRASDYKETTWNDNLTKIWSHRGTIHVINENELGLYLSAADMGGPFRDGAWNMTAEEQTYWAPFIQNEINNGNNAREGLKNACQKAGMPESLMEKAFYGWGGLIKEMTWRGLLACGTGTDKTYHIPKHVEWTDRETARKTLIRKYFETFGPATKRDCAAFFGYPGAEITPLISEITQDLQETQVDGKKYYHAKSLQEGEIPPCVLLPGFDQTVLAYRDRTRMIDKEHSRRTVNAAGIVFPLIILRGRARAKWKLDKDKITVTPFEKLLKKDEAAIRRTAGKELNIKDVEIIKDGE